eukprot:CAMPEP_0201516784 /NCGR_PEP_ID=MMETSP0161_2-20130828/8051_1 /ASSEMBLY_ACC=CAM_ASM_000251 /TAXON_ID=180227 /ORGANISM="Neoparamoeba aestuarina, Strain SoJaBio B1-5/56/2" /LENGTH=309 /DNA_ID=CAMNT_0047914065 /DNA_START=34 /DNA_END=963 /DNA_ORIENTATION=+
MADNSQDNFRFNVEEKDVWVPYLKEHGYVVIKEVANEQERETAISHFWDLFEKDHDVTRNEPDTWKDWYVDRRGISLDVNVMQGKGAWFVRGLPKCKQAFSSIWEEEDLITSMDSILMWKPWWVDENWTPRTEGLHIDQNPGRQPNFECVQGMVALYDVTPEIGGLEVVKGSHLKSEENGFTSKYYASSISNFHPLPRKHPAQGTGELLEVKAGDLILWDSRTIHGGLVGTATPENPPKGVEPGRMARLTVTVCMVPRKKASKAALKRRKEGFEKGRGFNHEPHEGRITAYSNGNYKPIELTKEQQALL